MYVSETLQERSQVSAALKWDLSAIFESERAFEETLEQLGGKAKEFKDQYAGRLMEAGIILESIQGYESIQSLTSRVYDYAFLPTSVDITDAESQKRVQRVSNELAKLGAILSFYESELMEAEEATLDAVVALDERYEPFIREVKKGKAHKLPAVVEEALANLSPVLDSHAELFEQIRSADADFGTFEANGKQHDLSFVGYEEGYMYSEDGEIRRQSYDQFNQVLGQYQHTAATNYYNHVMKEKTLATMRGYDSVIDYLLDSQDVDRAMYDRQIDLIMSDFAPVMRKYITHVKEEQGLDKMTYADLKLDLDPDYTETLTIDESREVIAQAVEVLGDDYVDIMMRAYDENWIDFARNKGKRSGAFCSTPADTHPYIMLSYSGLLSDAYTLIHELGHAGHFHYVYQEQVLTAGRPSLYLIEAPSTFNELLLSDYLRKDADSPRKERSIIAKMISKTYFHNFVTHLLEADFQRKVYERIDAGQGFDANVLNELKRETLEAFWGDAVEIEPGAELTWMRQVHYFYGLYPYTYSAGLTIATQAFLKLKAGELEAENWLDFLKLGGRQLPKDAAKVAGVDVGSDQALKDTIAYLDESVDRMIELTTQI